MIFFIFYVVLLFVKPGKNLEAQVWKLCISRVSVFLLFEKLGCIHVRYFGSESFFDTSWHMTPKHIVADVSNLINGELHKLYKGIKIWWSIWW